MNYPLLRRFLLKSAAETTNPALQGDMIRLLQQVSPDAAVQEGEDDEVVAPDLHRGLPSQNQGVKGVEDLMLRKAMPELQHQNPETPEVFGKVNAPMATATSMQPMAKISMLTKIKRAARMGVKMAAYIKDITVSDLPPKVQEEVRRFIPKTPKNPVVIHYGMTVRELVDKVDIHNFKTATDAVRKDMDALTKADKKKAEDEVFKKVKEKYILLVNDQIVDGHHFLAKAKYFNVTCSLNVVDLTPARFQ